jgi:phosphinothricin acetyltransferase
MTVERQNSTTIPLIRLATEHDAAQIQAIYSPVVSQTATSFEATPPTVDEMRQRIVETLAHLPWLVCEHEGIILGYVYAGKHRARTAYQWSVEVSAYVHAQARRMGVGRALYRSLFKILTLQGFYNVYAGITLPNPASVGLHEAMGFKPIGVYKTVGYKMNAWHDVGWWYLSLRPKTVPPQPLLDLHAVLESKDGEVAIAAGLRLLRI